MTVWVSVCGGTSSRRFGSDSSAAYTDTVWGVLHVLSLKVRVSLSTLMSELPPSTDTDTVPEGWLSSTTE